MEENVKIAINKLAQYLKVIGFKKNALIWIKEKSEFVLVVDLQKSAWSSEYYVNVGISFNKVNISLLKTYKCDIQYRVINNKDIYKIEEDTEGVILSIQEQVINIFLQLETIEDIGLVISENKDRYLLTSRAKKLLNLT